MIGYAATEAKDIRWRNSQGGIFPLSPLAELVKVSERDARRILAEQGAFFIRWESDFDQMKEGPWWHVIKDSPNNLETLSKKTRYMIRKASKLYEAMPIDIEQILEDGYRVYVSAYERYETHERMYEKEEFCEAVKALPCQTEWWGIYTKDTQQLVAFSENYVEKETCFYVTMWLEPDAMAKFAGYLLFHKMELHYLSERGLKYVSDGARSLSHDTNIHEFLIRKFNFRKAYARLHVVYAPWLGALLAVTFPFRKLIANVPWGPFKKASILLKQEEIRRHCIKSTN